MKFLIVAAAILAIVSAQAPPIQYNPVPYSFNYLAEGEEGTSGHQETGDGAGNVQGSYTLTDVDGRNRVVEYTAGPDGFRAIVRTNEPGTDNSSPAGVIFESTSPEAKGPIIRYSAEPVARPVAPRVVPSADGRQGNVRYVYVPSTDPRAAGRS
ncbi:adult-specific rigid cuticular protein 15.7-like [Stegodyphus dumicola]|uniref:adult-specific rigid cuticular protein 15.7-like n=1 Tax=Stegodyphus dumicola TaxID=202533 RepID=UPI0015AB84C7|nr:adult-specific rigid cuticular protein 15.7-like [Stegodyphus dumicola]